MTPEITNQSIDLQVKWLRHLQADVKALSPDRINMIRAYLVKTGVHTQMIDVFEKMRAHLMTDDSPQLYQKYKDVRESFNAYLDLRIASLNSLEFHHLQDLFNDIDLIVKYDIEEGLDVASNEIQELIRMFPGKEALKQLDKCVQNKNFAEGRKLLMDLGDLFSP